MACSMLLEPPGRGEGRVAKTTKCNDIACMQVKRLRSSNQAGSWACGLQQPLKDRWLRAWMVAVVAFVVVVGVSKIYCLCTRWYIGQTGAEMCILPPPAEAGRRASEATGSPRTRKP